MIGLESKASEDEILPTPIENQGKERAANEVKSEVRQETHVELKALDPLVNQIILEAP